VAPVKKNPTLVGGGEAARGALDGGGEAARESYTAEGKHRGRRYTVEEKQQGRTAEGSNAGVGGCERSGASEEDTCGMYRGLCREYEDVFAN
jgi:hypothetical protein